MNVEEHMQTFIRDIKDILSKPSLNQRDFREVIDVADKAIRELDEAEADWRADMEISAMQQNESKTESWILKHPARISRPGQVEVIRHVPDFNQAVAQASKFHSMLSERHVRSKIMTDSTKDFITILEMAEGSTEADVREAFLNKEGYVKLLHLDDLFR